MTGLADNLARLKAGLWSRSQHEPKQVDISAVPHKTLLVLTPKEVHDLTVEEVRAYAANRHISLAVFNKNPRVAGTLAMRGMLEGIEFESPESLLESINTWREKPAYVFISRSMARAGDVMKKLQSAEWATPANIQGYNFSQHAVGKQ